MGLAASKQEAFWEACGFGHTERVRQFIAQGIDVNWVSYTHDSCAIHVASQGKPEIVKMLLDANCNVNARDERGSIALHHAAMKGHGDIGKMLILSGSEVNAQDKNFWTPVINAAYFCQPDVVELLLTHKCDVLLQNKDDRSALHEACRSQSKDDEGLGRIARKLIEAGSDINSKSSDVGEADFTPLMFTAYHGHTSVAEALIGAGCDINAQGSNGWTALHWAADRGHVAMTRLLLDAGVDPLLLGRRGEMAVDRAYLSEIRQLLQSAIDDTKDEEGSPSHSQVSAQLKALNNSISAKAVQNQALVARLTQMELDRRSPVSTMDGSESESSLPSSPEMSHREKAEVEPLEKDSVCLHRGGGNLNDRAAPTADAEDLDDSFDGGVMASADTRRHDVAIDGGVMASADTRRHDVAIDVNSDDIIRETQYVKKSKSPKKETLNSRELEIRCDQDSTKHNVGVNVQSADIIMETHYKKKPKSNELITGSDKVGEVGKEDLPSTSNSPVKETVSEKHRVDGDDIIDGNAFVDGLKDIPNIDQSL